MFKNVILIIFVIALLIVLKQYFKNNHVSKGQVAIDKSINCKAIVIWLSQITCL